jgi:hypothetical protein
MNLGTADRPRSVTNDRQFTETGFSALAAHSNKQSSLDKMKRETQPSTARRTHATAPKLRYLFSSASPRRMNDSDERSRP